MLNLLPGALTFTITLMLVIDWALHRRSLLWYAGPAIVGVFAAVQLSERYLINMFLGGGLGGVVGWMIFKLPVDWVAFRWQRELLIKPLRFAGKNRRRLIGDEGIMLSTLVERKLPVARTLVVTPVALMEHLSLTTMEQDLSALGANQTELDHTALQKISAHAQRLILERDLNITARAALNRALRHLWRRHSGRAIWLRSWPVDSLGKVNQAQAVGPCHTTREMHLALRQCWAGHYSVEALQARLDEGASLLDTELVVGLQVIGEPWSTGLVAATDPTGAARGWIVERWRGSGAWAEEITPPTQRIEQRSETQPGDGTFSNVHRAQIVRAAQMADVTLDERHVLRWVIDEGGEVCIVGIEGLFTAEEIEISPEANLRWRVGGPIPTAVPEGTAVALERIDRRWLRHLGEVRVFHVEAGSVLGSFAQLCRAKGVSLLIPRSPLREH